MKKAIREALLRKRHSPEAMELAAYQETKARALADIETLKYMVERLDEWIEELKPRVEPGRAKP